MAFFYVIIITFRYSVCANVRETVVLFVLINPAVNPGLYLWMMAEICVRSAPGTDLRDFRRYPSEPNTATLGFFNTCTGEFAG